ncbi:hypothetical protein BDZ94DRAFT_1262215 [Collybia nuda]|uniref:Uncharacterized protein n=1 Tax=Collybia nuda TaxID=64659 RepID=A0A9P5Y4C2_9AGAR|nr:hypothetical protein BDZ94DRAFT_1262215 [Collybia nuda]
MTPPPKRRRPHCRACGSPMAGHKRSQGHLVCPDWSTDSKTFSTLPASPPLTPPRSSTPQTPPRTPTPISPKASPRSVAPLVMPETGPWHRRNPNWRTPSPPLRPPSPIGSLVPTVLVDDDGNTIQGSNYPSDAEWDDADEEEEKEEDKLEEEYEDLALSSYASFGVMNQITGQPIVSIYGTSRKNIPQLRNVAAKLGAHTGFLPTPPRSQKKGRKGSPVSRENSWWCVMSKSPELVYQVVDSQHRKMPGLMGEDLPTEGPRMTTFLHLTLAGFIGGCVAVYGLSYL